MPMREADPSDPTELIGVRIPVADDSAMWEMAECFAEELLRLGHSEQEVLAIFGNAFYAGPFAASRRLGEETIREIVQKYARIFRRTDTGEGDRHGDRV